MLAAGTAVLSSAVTAVAMKRALFNDGEAQSYSELFDQGGATSGHLTKVAQGCRPVIPISRRLLKVQSTALCQLKVMQPRADIARTVATADSSAILFSNISSEIPEGTVAVSLVRNSSLVSSSRQVSDRV